MALRLRGSTSGYAEIDAPAVAGDVTLTLPSTTGTINVKDASGNTNVGTGVTFGNPGANIFTINNTGGERLRIAADGTVSIPGALNVSGVLTYEDVTSVDAIGLSTFRDGLNTKDVGITTISSTDVNNSGTAVDIFVYDTSKDSDGGAWRKRTSHTSWYNETLNTATRGSRKEFPAVAVIVSEQDKVTIYDGDDPDLPMWLVLNEVDSSAGLLRVPASGDSQPKLSALNGIVSLACNDSRNGFIALEFVKDSAFKLRNSTEGGSSPFSVFENLSLRNSASIPSRYNTDKELVNTFCNDVAMTMLPNAPIDDATGLPVPTIAVATEGGISVIKDDGNVFDITATDYDFTSSISFTEDNELIFSWDNNTRGRFIHVYDIPSSDVGHGGVGYQYGAGKRFYTNYGPSSKDLVIWNNTSTSWDTKDVLSNGIGHTQGLTLLDEDPTVPANGMVAFASTSYNTGWLHGDIKGAFLSGISTANVTGSELVVDGSSNWVGDFDVSADADSWTSISSATLSVVSNELYIQHNGTNSAGAYYDFNVVDGEVYVVSFDARSSSASQLIKPRLEAQGSVTFDTSFASVTKGTLHNNTTTLIENRSSSDHEVDQSYSIQLKAVGTGTVRFSMIANFTASAYVDNVSIRKAELDRSANNNGLQVFGTVNKQPVVSGADLVGYSNFGNNNYLQQSYNSDLDFGTGDYSIILWAYRTANATKIMVDKSRQNGTQTNRLSLYFDNSTGFVELYEANSATLTSDTILQLNRWTKIAYTRSGSKGSLYMDGELVGTAVMAGNVGDSNHKLVIGNGYDYSYGWGGSLALVRISATAPSAEQIKKMYEDEKVFFQENAKATLYGSSDAVTALAYDEVTDQLHVGTSSGRSDFQGLRRINNTTVGITSAISAHDSFILEQ